MITRKRTDDEDNFIRKLHECILTECSEKLGKVSDFFGLPKIKLTTETLADFGNKDFLNYMIDKELNIQFYTRKINLLKAMATFINQSEQKNKADLFYAYGTKNFNLVWEDVCKSIYKNQLNMSLKEILRTEILEGLKGFKERADSILIKLIDKSVWMLDDIKKYDAEETLEPDIVNLKEMNDHIEFNIYDAKYYTIKTENTNIKGNPGISDVTKQYLYQLAYQTFIKALGKLKKVQVRNAFVLPKEKDYEEPINKVSLKFLSDIGLKEIDVIHIDDQKAYNAYLKNACLEQNK